MIGFECVGRKVIAEYSKAIHELAMDLAKKMAESLGLEGVDFKDWPCQFRINKYNFSPESVGSTGVQIHTDSGFLTILQDDENVGGLEAMDSSGSFVEVPTWAGTLVVNLGDVAHVSIANTFTSMLKSNARITFLTSLQKHIFT